MNMTSAYWLTRVGCLNETLQGIFALAILFLAVYGLISVLKRIDPSFTEFTKILASMKKPMKWVIAVAVISAVLCHVIPTSDEVKLMVMTQVAAEHGIKLTVEK